MHNLYFMYFVNLYMFRVYLSPSSGGTKGCRKQQVHILFRRLSGVLVGLEQSSQDNRQPSKKDTALQAGSWRVRFLMVS